jgi:hypothetical protein
MLRHGLDHDGVRLGRAATLAVSRKTSPPSANHHRSRVHADPHREARATARSASSVWRLDQLK